MAKAPAVYFVSSNSHKYHEIQGILSKYKIVLKHKKLNLAEPEMENIEDIAKFKGLQAYNELKKPVLVEDTGIYFDAYKNFPGIFPKRMFEALGYEGLLKLLEGKSHNAFFKTSLYFKDGENARMFTGLMKGTITDETHGVHENVMPYERIFIATKKPEKPLVFLSREDKAAISHRAHATRKFAEWFSMQYHTNKKMELVFGKSKKK